MEGFCRGCLIKYDDLTKLLQYTEKNRRLFVYSTGLQVKRNDAFTFQLCKDCYVNMKLACNFKKQCRSADKKIRNYHALNEAGETVDFCTFLKNNDEYMAFRFPMTFGNSTPANQKAREEDNESTCTSIRNFMRDIMQNEEIPETEARIIREVIEEEAEILDDSLDSRWLQDDVSIDTDFRVDFSFSGFSTPHSINNDHCYTPKRLEDYVEQKSENHNIFNQIPEKSLEAVNDSYQAMKNNLQISDNIKTGINDEENYYTIKRIPEDDEYGVPVVNNDKLQSDENIADGLVCTIDRNIERALKNNKDKSFCLDDLLNSPQVYTSVAPATPTINNILFGDKLDLDNKNQHFNTQKIDQAIEQYRNISIDSDILADFFVKPDPYEDSKLEYVYNYEEFKADDIVIDRVDKEKYNGNEDEVNEENHEENGEPPPVEDPYDIPNLYCNICKKQYTSMKAFKIHVNKKHSTQIVATRIKTWNMKMLCACEYCGRQFSYMNSLKRHKKVHERPESDSGYNNKEYKCEKCTLTFSSQYKLDVHTSVHTGLPPKRSDVEKKYVCDICGAKFANTGNLNIHKRRHTKTYSKYCDDCGKGFVRKAELVVHMRYHTGIQPYSCRFCTRTFTRLDQYTKHTLTHTGEKPYKCDVCKQSFTRKGILKTHIDSAMKCKRLREKLLTKIEKKKEKTKRKNLRNMSSS